MKKLNNKGMSLIELIISFSWVCVAIIYFFETLFITNKILRTTREDTNNYVDVAYAFNIIEYYVHHNDEFKNYINEYKISDAKNILDFYVNGFNDAEFKAKTSYVDTITRTEKKSELGNASFNATQNDYIYYYKFFINGKEYYYFFATTPKIL